MRWKDQWNDKSALGFSIALHALVVALITLQLPWFKPSAEAWTEASKSITTRTLSEADLSKLQQQHQKQMSQQIVQSTDLHSDKNLAAPLKEKIYLSEKTNVVDQNTKAGRVGEFKNVEHEGVQTKVKATERKPAAVAESPAEKHTSLVKNLFNLAPSPDAPKNAPKGGRGPASVPDPTKSGEGFSATNDYMPDVAIGANTLLNTQEFKYYSFYERIRQKLAFQWESRLRSGFESLVSQGVKQISGDRITRLRIFLKPDGSLARTDLVGTSGYHELDRAALEAFRAAAPFPNPPQGLIEGKGELSIDWSFVVITAEDSGMQLSVRRDPAAGFN